MRTVSIEPEIATVRLASRAEHHLSVLADDGKLPDINGHMPAGAHKLHQFVFAGCHHYKASEAAQSTDTPTTWLQGDACGGGEMLSMQILAISGVKPEPVMLDGRPLGYVYEDTAARYCYLGGILPRDANASREDQTLSVLERMATALESCGMGMTNIVRTWLYLDRLLDWYGPFNTVRTTFFREHGIFDNLVPASTGIGAANPFGAALTAGLIAVQPINDLVTIKAVESPLQCSARDYASSFSRAVEVAFTDHRTIYVSGTASIDAEGRSIHLDDPERQVARTMEVVTAILESSGMSWSDAVRGIAYFKDIRRHQPLYNAYCAEHGIPAFPLAISHADVCRHDLLFEIEVDAMTVA